jgi:transcriptional regulator with XRE-family HTH domain
MTAKMMEVNMGVKLEEMLGRLPADRRQRIDARADRLIAQELSLRDLRKAMGKTQQAVAKKLHMKQENVSRLEQRADVLLSTLDSYLKALGGSLRLVAVFKDRDPVTLTGFGEIEELRREPAAPAKGKRSRTRAEAA